MWQFIHVLRFIHTWCGAAHCVVFAAACRSMVYHIFLILHRLTYIYKMQDTWHCNAVHYIQCE